MYSILNLTEESIRGIKKIYMNNVEENLEDVHSHNLLWTQMVIFQEISFIIQDLQSQEDKHLR